MLPVGFDYFLETGLCPFTSLGPRWMLFLATAIGCLPASGPIMIGVISNFSLLETSITLQIPITQ